LDLRSESAEIGPIIAPGSNRRFSMRGDLDRMDQIKLDFIDGENALKERMKENPDELSKEIEKFNKSTVNPFMLFIINHLYFK
jgi:hypothetical protein